MKKIILKKIIYLIAIIVPAVVFAATYTLQTGWFSDSIDRGIEDVGYESSIAVDRLVNPHISYYDSTNGDLKYIRWATSNDILILDKNVKYSNGWLIHTVDKLGKVGRYSSIKLDRMERPNISYYDVGNSALKFARYDGAKWSISLVDAGFVGRYSSLVLDKSDRPHISYYDSARGALKYAFWDGFKWNVEFVDYPRNGNVGRFTSIAIGDNDKPHIAYYDSGNGCLKYAYLTGSDWKIETIDGDGGESNVGQYASIVLGNGNMPHISYYDVYRRCLKYAVKKGYSWEINTIDGGNGAPDVGQFSCVKLDNYNNPNICYYDATYNQLKLAKKEGTGWNFTCVDREQGNDIGSDCSMVFDMNGNWHISYRDKSNTNLKYANSKPIDIPVDKLKGFKWVPSQ